MKNKRIIIITIVLILLIVFLLFLVFNYSKDDFIVKNWYTKSEDFSISLFIDFETIIDNKASLIETNPAAFIIATFLALLLIITNYY